MGSAGLGECFGVEAVFVKLQSKSPCFLGRGFQGESGDDLLSHGQSAVSSALRCFTVLFGMGRRGTTSLRSPDKAVGTLFSQRSTFVY